MGVLYDIILPLLDWRFVAGLVVGIICTFRYIVIGVYHPIIRELEGLLNGKQNDDPET